MIFDPSKIIEYEIGMSFEPGMIVQGVPIDIYHGDECKTFDSCTALKKALDHYDDYLHAKYEDLTPTIALERGGAFHAEMEARHWDLEAAEIIESETAGINTKKWQAQKEANPGQFVLPAEEIKLVSKMADKVWLKGRKLNTFANVWPELSLFWQDEETQLLLKTRPDLTRFDRRMFGEYKTTRCRSRAEFAKEIANRNYDFQLAMQADGLYQTTGIDYLFDEPGNVGYAMMITITNSPPIRCHIYPVFKRVIETGRRKYRRALELVKQGAPADEYEYIDIPEWAHRFDETI